MSRYEWAVFHVTDQANARPLEDRAYMDRAEAQRMADRYSPRMSLEVRVRAIGEWTK